MENRFWTGFAMISEPIGLTPLKIIERSGMEHDLHATVLTNRQLLILLSHILKFHPVAGCRFRHPAPKSDRNPDAPEKL